MFEDKKIYINPFIGHFYKGQVESIPCLLRTCLELLKHGLLLRGFRTFIEQLMALLWQFGEFFSEPSWGGNSSQIYWAWICNSSKVVETIPTDRVILWSNVHASSFHNFYHHLRGRNFNTLLVVLNIRVESKIAHGISICFKNNWTTFQKKCCAFVMRIYLPNCDTPLVNLQRVSVLAREKTSSMIIMVGWKLELWLHALFFSHVT